MNKIRRNVSISKHTDSIINKYKKEFDFNFSKWVENKFLEEFSQEENDSIEISKYQIKIKEIKNKRKIFNQSINELYNSLSEDEHEFIGNIHKKLKKGANLYAITKCFNVQFSNNFTPMHIKKLMLIDVKINL